MKYKDINFRKANKNDIKQICDIRKTQLIDDGMRAEQDIDCELENFFKKCFEENSIYQILGIKDDKIVATGAVCFYNYPPTFINKSGKIAYITNMYTAPEYRRMGIASYILNLLLSEVNRREVKITRLLATKLGRPVYTKYGFTQSDRWMYIKHD